MAPEEPESTQLSVRGIQCGWPEQITRRWMLGALQLQAM